MVEQTTLTARELEVLQRIACGDTDKELAKHLHISGGTAGMHVTNIIGKLEARNRTHAVVLALKRGLISLEAM